ncbi:MAG: SufD family Fe-S cluster assembly protein [Defluviitaleaceae bacterium]|nr:SufD family Fe-S cluster assembly protein [Defluviitaleaceae bacterium]
MSQANLLLPLAEKTNIKDWDFENLDLKDVSAPSIEISDVIPEGVKNYIVIVDGWVVFKNLENGIKLENKGIELIRENNKLIDINKNKKNSLLTVTIEKNTNLSEPLYITYVSKNRSLVHQTEIILQESSSANIVETFVSDSKFNSNIISKIAVGANANLNTSVINRLNGESTVYYHRMTEVAADATLEATNFIINDSNVVFEDFTHLVGKGANANVATVSIATKEQKQNLTIRVENLAPFSNGNIVNYGISKDSAHLAFNGIGKIHKGMNGGDNQQETRVLNLSVSSEAIANPFLLIDEGDITAGHAASIGQLDEEQVYYLMSRGLSKQESEKLIVSGFLTPFANIIKNEVLKDELLNSIEVKLG